MIGHQHLLFQNVAGQQTLSSTTYSFKNTMTELAPVWLRGKFGTAVLQTFGQVLDDLMLQVKLGMRARLPLTAPADALKYIANDRLIERGPSETDASIRNRLQNAFPMHKTRGNAPGLLQTLAGYFTGIGLPALRLVSSNSVWHEYSWLTGLVTKTVVQGQNTPGGMGMFMPYSNQPGMNWNWDSLVTSWWRGWVIIDVSSLNGAWATRPLTCGVNGGTWDDGAICGTGNVTESTVRTIQRLVQRWKPENVYVNRIIICFTNQLYLRTNAMPPNPNGQMADPSQFSDDAAYWMGGGEEPT